MIKLQKPFLPWVRSKAFTLVELIVVIVILAILATIAFISFSSQSSSARDSKRLADISNIVKWIWVVQSISGKLPIPDNKISVTASWILLTYQWYAGQNVLNMIKLSDWWKDPLDKSTYYTYSTDSSQSKFQMLWFLEDGNNVALSFSPFADENASAEPASYSGRYIYTKWDKMTVLFSSWTMMPIQSEFSASSFTWIDVMSSDKELSALIEDNQIISWTWVVLKAIIWWAELIWYWSFDEWSWIKANDYSGNWNNWILTWSFLPIWSWWIIWKSLFFNNSLTQTGFFDVGPSLSLSPEYLDMNLWIKSDWTNPNITPTTRILRNRYYGYSIGYSWWIVTCNWTYSWWYLAISHTEEIKDNEWHNIHCSYSSNRQALYVDWLKINENYKPSPPIYYLWNHFWIWKDANWSWGYYFWSIDEVRMYKRPLTDSEINNLYKIAK
ncbi:MAG: hypothetical protein ACD_3C00029G0006 [uncultured bacterium (gcode 4)]|uniref:Prepilin-type N-terminal cleavage/methylation domain-containing protein n=1 Tax=uncultured bacterium (gcode 4) TaxID=1234023 RepID=K2G0F1_9BACT|nr:MAG: hypothetical protein ACD_3C00029G0006 [uncultured bacterium (gcode 4)]